MKEYIEIQKNVAALMGPIILGCTFIILGIVIMCTANIFLGAIFTLCIVFGIIILIAVLIKNYEISRVRIDKKGVYIKEKSGLKLIYWEEFINCTVIHKGRGTYCIFLLTKERQYRIIHGIYVVEKLIEYCSVPSFAECLKSQKDNQ